MLRIVCVEIIGKWKFCTAQWIELTTYTAWLLIWICAYSIHMEHNFSSVQQTTFAINGKCNRKYKRKKRVKDFLFVTKIKRWHNSCSGMFVYIPIPMFECISLRHMKIYFRNRKFRMKVVVVGYELQTTAKRQWVRVRQDRETVGGGKTSNQDPKQIWLRTDLDYISYCGVFCCFIPYKFKAFICV